LTDVSFSVAPGTIAAVAAEPLEFGSLLIDCIGGAHPVSGGEIRVGGTRVAPGLPAGALPLSIIRGPGHFPEGVTVREWLEQIAMLLGDDAASVDSVIERLDLRDAEQKPLTALNVEEKQLVRLGAGALGKPAVILVDRLDRDLAPQRRRVVSRFVNELRRAGTSMVFTSETVEMLEAVCSLVVVIKDGRVAKCDTPENLVLSGQQWMRIEVFSDSNVDVDKLGDVECVDRVVQHGSKYAVFAKNEFASVRTVLGFLDEAGADVSDLRTYRATLADVLWELL